MTFPNWLRRANPTNYHGPLHSSQQSPTFWNLSSDKPWSCRRPIWIHRTLANKVKIFCRSTENGLACGGLDNYIETMMKISSLIIWSKLGADFEGALIYEGTINVDVKYTLNRNCVLCMRYSLQSTRRPTSYRKECLWFFVYMYFDTVAILCTGLI